MKHLIAPLLIAISFPVFADEMTTTRGFPTPRSIERDGRMTQLMAIDVGGTTQAVIPAGVGVTQQAIYFTASNADAVASFLYINVAKATSGGSPIVTVKAYVYNRNVDTRFEVFRTVIDTGTEQTVILTEPVGFNLSPTDVLYWVADTNTNNATAVIRFSLREYERPA